MVFPIVSRPFTEFWNKSPTIWIRGIKTKKRLEPPGGSSLGYLQKDYLQLRGGDPQPSSSPRRRELFLCVIYLVDMKVPPFPCRIGYKKVTIKKK